MFTGTHTVSFPTPKGIYKPLIMTALVKTETQKLELYFALSFASIGAIWMIYHGLANIQHNKNVCWLV